MQLHAHPHVWSRRFPAAAALLRRWVRGQMALRLYIVHYGACRELTCHPRARHQGLTLLAEILMASADGNWAFCGVPRTQGTLGEQGLRALSWMHLLHCGHWVRMNFIPGKPQSHTVWFTVSLARVEPPLSSSRVGQGGRCILEVPQEPCANVCLPCSSLHTQPGFPFLLCPSQPGLSVPTLCAFLAWRSQHHQHLGTVQSAAAPCSTDAKWLLADGLPADACPTDVHLPCCQARFPRQGGHQCLLLPHRH